MITIKDYARGRGISYEAARQQISRYMEREVDGFRLADHISKVDRTQYLDDEAVAFLDERRAKNPVIVQQEERDETIERLRAEVDLLQKRLIAAQDEYRDLLKEKHAIEMREQGLLADKQRIEEFKAAALEAEGRAAQAEERERAAIDAKDVAEAGVAAVKRDLDKALTEAAAAERAARTEIERLQAENDAATAAAVEAKEKADRMDRAGLIARIFRSW